MAHEDATEQIVSIRWAKYSGKCLGVSHEPSKGLPGMGLHIWDCAKDPHDRELFVLPLPGHVGPIKAVKFPHLCLETHDGLHLSFELCSTLPQAHMLWTLRQGNFEGYHHIHMAADTARCLDIPNGNAANGNWVQLLQCSEAYGGIICDGEGQQGATPTVPAPGGQRTETSEEKGIVPQPEWDFAVDVPNWAWWWVLALFFMLLLCCYLCLRCVRVQLVVKPRAPKGDDEDKLLPDEDRRHEVGTAPGRSAGRGGRSRSGALQPPQYTPTTREVLPGQAAAGVGLEPLSGGQNNWVYVQASSASAEHVQHL